MTLVLAVTSRKSIWMLTDRRLSYRNRPPRDDARKVMCLETIDALAILGYAGLGSTALGTEPGDWMVRVLRGRNLTLEKSLVVLADAVRAKLPRHLAALPTSPVQAHHIIIPAFVDSEPRLYSIDVVRSRNHSQYSFRCARHVTGRQLSARHTTPRVAVGGSGAIHLPGDLRWGRELLRAVAAHDAGRISARAAASVFARLNYQVAQAEATVSQRCIVVWRLQKGGGGQEFYDGVQKETSSSGAWVPFIVLGLDINALAQTIMPFAMPMLDALRRGETEELDSEAMNAELAKLPEGPDDSLA